MFTMFSERVSIISLKIGKRNGPPVQVCPILCTKGMPVESYSYSQAAGSEIRPSEVASRRGRGTMVPAWEPFEMSPYAGQRDKGRRPGPRPKRADAPDLSPG